MISTKGRYSIRVLLDLAEHANGEYIPMKDVAERQGLSLKYLERILPVLTKNKLVEAMHGKGGGYRLTKAPDEYTIWEILTLAEGGLSPVACLEEDADSCPRAGSCKTLPMWKEYYDLIRNFFQNKTLADLMEVEDADFYVI